MSIQQSINSTLGSVSQLATVKKGLEKLDESNKMQATEQEVAKKQIQQEIENNEQYLKNDTDMRLPEAIQNANPSEATDKITSKDEWVDRYLNQQLEGAEKGVSEAQDKHMYAQTDYEMAQVEGKSSKQISSAKGQMTRAKKEWEKAILARSEVEQSIRTRNKIKQDIENAKKKLATYEEVK